MVYFDGANGDVLKITRVGLFGAYYELIEGRIHEFKCTPAEYLIRLRLLEKQFGFSQIPLGGAEPWVGDARADNFVNTAEGIIPIDLRMWQVIDPGLT